MVIEYISRRREETLFDILDELLDNLDRMSDRATDHEIASYCANKGRKVQLMIQELEKMGLGR